MYCSIGYFGGKQIKYIVSEHFTDSFLQLPIPIPDYFLN